MKYLGIDLGGTNVAAAVVDSEGTILGKVSLPTPRGAEAVADQMAAAARGAAEAAGTALDEVASVGIGAPGAIEPDTGVIKYWSNLDFTNVPITALMKARLDKEILLENDANAAALGEYAAGAGKGSQSMVAVTLGTGVGGGAILNGKLYTGFNYAGLEIGHFVIDEYVDYLGCGVASLVNIFQPEVICIGGGPSAQGETLMAPVRYILNREDYARNNLHRTRLVRAALGNDAGLIGAALLPLFR